ncbi:MAG: septum formation protein Maf [Alphaproteobacteria bacterium]|nr:septum formation protein Maf [Alphaproteobacteria bacterium]
MSDPVPLILASASPRRVELLAQIGVTPDCVLPAHVDEIPLKNELPIDMARRLAEAKAREIHKDHPTACVIGADTVVALGRRILGKAEDEAHARRYLSMLSGRGHRVIGGVAVIAPGGRTAVRAVTTKVDFKRLEDAEIDAYIQSGEWRDKAGAYAIQGRAGAFVRRINGSYSNVVGLALFDVANMVKGLGVRPPGLI